jgi:hypothetical protein
MLLAEGFRTGVRLPRLHQSYPIKSNSFFIFGARGTGKTTFLKSFFEPETVEYIAVGALIAALTVAAINRVTVRDYESREMEVTVSEDQLSLAIGREGQTPGWRLNSPAGASISRACARTPRHRRDPYPGSRVRAEVTKTGATNIDELRKRVQAATAGSEGEGGKSTRPAKRIRIRKDTPRQSLVDDHYTERTDRVRVLDAASTHDRHSQKSRKSPRLAHPQPLTYPPASRFAGKGQFHQLSHVEYTSVRDLL